MQGKMPKRKLFISFQATMRDMASGSATPADLERGLFYFTWPREDVLAPWSDDINELEWFFNSNDEGHKAHEVFRTAVLRAEAEGRAKFHKGRGYEVNPYDELNDLLSRNGYATLPVTEVKRSDYPRDVETLILLAGLVEVLVVVK